MKYASCMWRTLVNMAHSSLAFPGFRNWTSYSWLCILWYPHRIRIISLMRLGTVCNGQTIGEPLLFVDSEKIPRFYGVPIYIDAHWVWGFPSHVRITHQKPTLNPHVDPFFYSQYVPMIFPQYSHPHPLSHDFCHVSHDIPMKNTIFVQLFRLLGRAGACDLMWTGESRRGRWRESWRNFTWVYGRYIELVGL